VTKGKDGRQMHPNSLANMDRKIPPTKEEQEFGETFKADIIALWTKMTEGKTLDQLEWEEGMTIGQALMLEAAKKSPMSFVKMASTMLPKDTADRVKPVLDFAETLAKLNARVKKKAPAIEETTEVVDINVLDEEPLPL
jgi:hypothetical protein